MLEVSCTGHHGNRPPSWIFKIQTVWLVKRRIYRDFFVIQDGGRCRLGFSKIRNFNAL